MKFFVISLIVSLAPLASWSKNQMTPAHSKYLYKTLAKYTQQSGTIRLDSLACLGNGLKICSYSPSVNTAGSFGWIPTTIAVTVLLENYVQPYQKSGTWVWEIHNLECTPQDCRFN